MKVDLTQYIDGKWTTGFSPNKEAQLVLVHASASFLNTALEEIDYLHSVYPNACIVTSCAQLLHEHQLSQKSCQVAALQLEKGSVKVASLEKEATKGKGSEAKKLLSQLPTKNLSHVHLIINTALTDGQHLLKDLSKALDPSITVSGSVSLDLADKEGQTILFQHEAQRAVMIGFYQPIEVHPRIESGWKSFGLKHTVTKVQGNWVCEFNNAPAVELLKDYFGPLSPQLPKIAWIHPLHCCCGSNDPKDLSVRSLLDVDPETGWVYTGANISKGCAVKFMMTTPHSLMKATHMAMEPLHHYCISEDQETGFLLANFAIPRYHFMQERAATEVALLQKVSEHNIDTKVIYTHGQIFRHSDGLIDISNLGVGLTLIFD